MNSVDVIIVGGGAAGLNAALILGRSKRSVQVIDANMPRNRVTHASHGFLTRDGSKPGEFKEMAIHELKKYPNVTYVEDIVTNVVKESHQFKIETVKGHSIYSKRIIVATGMKDELPDIEGIREVYGTSIFPCPYCDGWERRDEALAVIGNDSWLIHYVKMIYHWSQDLMVFTNGVSVFSSEELDQLNQKGIHVITDPIERLESKEGKLSSILVEGGQRYQRTGGFLSNTGEKQASNIAQQLGCKLADNGGVETDHNGHTSIEGLYVIGDAKNGFTGLINAASEGYIAGAHINHDLVIEEWSK